MTIQMQEQVNKLMYHSIKGRYVYHTAPPLSAQNITAS